MKNTSFGINQLMPGRQYRVVKTFVDYYQNPFKTGEVLTFVQSNFLPYHGGYTIVFKEKTLYLQEEENAMIIDSFHEYFMRVT